MDPNGKIALVTGASMGIGRAVALDLARGGARVAVNYRSSAAEAQAVLAEIEALGGEGILAQADVADEAAVRRMLDAVEARWGRLDILVNNAAITYFVPFPELDALTDDMWDTLYAINVKGLFWCARAGAALMRKDDGGVIVNIGSVAGVTGDGSSIAYCASKAAVHSLTKSLARALAPDIRVNCVSPGFVDTTWHARGVGEEQAARNRDNTARVTPLRRVCTPQDVSDAVMSMVSMDYVTGQVLMVNGGIFM
ncbi:MAG: glucose 1-dehydrogenase [Anaerolineae bacterium]